MYYSNSDIRIEEAPVPQTGEGELLMRVEASGICGSDVMEWYRRDKVPLVLGHEVSGTIAEVGKGVEKYRVGDRITAAHHVPCNTCYYCLRGDHTVCETLRSTNFDPGGFAEYLRLPAINVDRGVFPLPEHVSFEEATFVEPIACVLRGQRRAGLKAGDTVLVLGSGIAGLLHIHAARAMGAARIVATDVVEHRLNTALDFGADFVRDARDYSPEFLREINGGHPADKVLVCTGASIAISQALQSVERGGVILFFAPTTEDLSLPVPLNKVFWRNDVTLTTSYAGSPADYSMALELISSRRIQVKDMISHRLPLSETGSGFKMVLNPGEFKSIKVIIEPWKN
jgi:L-iditol 2-dehydrogenase